MKGGDGGREREERMVGAWYEERGGWWEREGEKE